MHDHLFGKSPLYLDQDSLQQDPAAARCPNPEFPPQKTYILTCRITILVSDLYTWIRTDPSRIQQLPVATRSPELIILYCKCIYQSNIPYIIITLNKTKSLLFKIFLFKRKIAWGLGESFKDGSGAAKRRFYRLFGGRYRYGSLFLLPRYI